MKKIQRCSVLGAGHGGRAMAAHLAATPTAEVDTAAAVSQPEESPACQG